MYLKLIKIKNYRLYKDVSISIDKELTMFVGKNNSGKTSIMQLLDMIISGNSMITFADYPISCRKKLYDTIFSVIDQKDLPNDLELYIKKIPETSVQFVIDYSDEEYEESLGALSDFIVDIDDTVNEVIIDACFRCEISKEILEWFREESNKVRNGIDGEDKINSYEICKQLVEKKFSSLFSLKIYTSEIGICENSSYVKENNDTFRIEVPERKLQHLFLLKNITAERGMDESENQEKTPLKKTLKHIFDKDIDDVEEELKGKIKQLAEMTNAYSNQAEEKINSTLSEIISAIAPFGYPSAEDLKLIVETTVSLESQIINDTRLSYISDKDPEKLPSTHNGLGYKNLIKISFIINEFCRELKSLPSGTIPILFIEEPEAHMHPQLQKRFIEYLTNVISSMTKNHVQIIITTHSSHIANAVPFNEIRYMCRYSNYVICKNLQDFHSNDNKFLQKYMRASTCDLYFCDKAILVEGAAERLLIPDMIRKLNEAKEFDDSNITLPFQYCTIIEVGGAYAKNFFGLLDFLEVPTLILTDIDFVCGSRHKACEKADANATSNATIMAWYREVVPDKDNQTPKIDEIINLPDEKKTIQKRHIEFQLEENGYYPRSLEDAILNSNKKLFKINNEPKYNATKYGSKTDFAINLLVNHDYKDYEIPSYIRRGLIWLDRQPKMSN